MGSFHKVPHLILVFALLFGGQAHADSVELIGDGKFQAPIKVIHPNGSAVAKPIVSPYAIANRPQIWRVTQWFSKSSLNPAAATIAADNFGQLAQ